MMARIGIICLLALGAGGCATKGPASVAGGECKIFERPEYAVRGKRPYDQDWIDSQVEGGVGACGWKRPAARPASINAAPARKPALVSPPKKRNVVQRIKDRITAAPAPAPAPYVAAPVLPVVAAPAPPSAPRDPVDELLQPSR